MRALRVVWRGLAFTGLAVVALQAAFAARVAVMAWLDPGSTAFERSEAWRLALAPRPMQWRQQWVDRDAIAPTLARAVLASEDAGFVEHFGIEWEAIERAWDRNQRPRPGRRPPKLVGGSTVTQQLAKNLFLSGERSYARKAQEALITFALEALLPKARILEIYLNHVEWGEGVFGAQAAARRHFGADAAALGAGQAARLAVMLPAPKRFERSPGSPYLAARAETILARMNAVELPPGWQR